MKIDINPTDMEPSWIRSGLEHRFNPRVRAIWAYLENSPGYSVRVRSSTRSLTQLGVSDSVDLQVYTHGTFIDVDISSDGEGDVWIKVCHNTKSRTAYLDHDRVVWHDNEQPVEDLIFEAFYHWTE